MTQIPIKFTSKREVQCHRGIPTPGVRSHRGLSSWSRTGACHILHPCSDTARVAAGDNLKGSIYSDVMSRSAYARHGYVTLAKSRRYSPALGRVQRSQRQLARLGPRREISVVLFGSRLLQTKTIRKCSPHLRSSARNPQPWQRWWCRVGILVISRKNSQDTCHT